MGYEPNGARLLIGSLFLYRPLLRPRCCFVTAHLQLDCALEVV